NTPPCAPSRAQLRARRSSVPSAPTAGAAALGLRQPKDLKSRHAKMIRPPKGPYRLRAKSERQLLQVAVMLPVLVAVHGATVGAAPALAPAGVRRSRREGGKQGEARDKCSKSLCADGHWCSPA